MPASFGTKLDIYIMAPEPISTVYFINPSHQSVYLYPSVVARQWLNKTITVAVKTQQ
jgi:hypothetical protein